MGHSFNRQTISSCYYSSFTSVCSTRHSCHHKNWQHSSLPLLCAKEIFSAIYICRSEAGTDTPAWILYLDTTHLSISINFNDVGSMCNQPRVFARFILLVSVTEAVLSLLPGRSTHYVLVTILVCSAKLTFVPSHWLEEVMGILSSCGVLSFLSDKLGQGPDPVLPLRTLSGFCWRLAEKHWLLETQLSQVVLVMGFSIFQVTKPETACYTWHCFVQ